METNTLKIGEFQKFHHPVYAECLDGSEFVVHTTKPSRFITGRVVEGESYFICPRCGAKHIKPEHGNAYQCKICRLKWQMYGNGLYIWE